MSRNTRCSESTVQGRSAKALLSIKNGGVQFKVEQEDDDDSLILGPAVLGLKRVGEEMPPRTSNLVLNRRGTPARVRKRNRLYYDDDIVSPPPQRSSPKKSVRIVNKKIKQEAEVSVAPDKRIAQRIGVRLRNLLKLPKAHKWVCYEWFYSNIDKALFEGQNDFMVCLRDSFRNLKTFKLTRVEWCKIRRLMGKPRRCSQSFFLEERAELGRKRQKIRNLQQRKNTDIGACRDLPDEIPLQLVIGTKVTARLRKPQDGLFLGSIDAVDTSNNTYRITFDRPGLGTHSIPDYEVLSNDPPETMPVASFAQKFRPRALNLYTSPMKFMSTPSSPHLTNDPLLGSSPTKKAISMDGSLGGFPVKFLDTLVRLSKILTVKKDKINILRNMNCEAERSRSFGCDISEDYQRRYASVVLDLERINKDLYDYLNGVQQYCQEIAPEQGLMPIDSPTHMKQQCMQDAQEMVAHFNTDDGSKAEGIEDQQVLNLVVNLTALLLHIKNLATSEHNPYELRAFQEAVQEVKNQLHPNHLRAFQGQIEIHLQHFQAGLAVGSSQNNATPTNSLHSAG